MQYCKLSKFPLEIVVKLGAMPMGVVMTSILVVTELSQKQKKENGFVFVTLWQA